ncbi:MAG: HNH endonuclease [Rhodanobacter sp.]
MRICIFPDCSRKHVALGLCRTHYMQQYEGRQLAPIRRGPAPIEPRFWAKVVKGSPSECWEWTGPKQPRGYGTFTVAGSGTLLAHRVSYELAVGPIPDGMFIDHMCHNRACVNPAHLHVVTRKQNNENLVIRSDNKSGVRGVCWNKKLSKWKGSVRHNGHQTHVGYFDSIAEAEAAVIAKRNELFTNNLADRRAS